MSVPTGTVKFYNGQKCFGFIQPDNGGKDVFVHATVLERAGIRTLVEGQKVSFDIEEDRRTRKSSAGNLRAEQFSAGNIYGLTRTRATPASGFCAPIHAWSHGAPRAKIS
jgi:CspA family cold shock protein